MEPEKMEKTEQAERTEPAERTEQAEPEKRTEQTEESTVKQVIRKFVRAATIRAVKTMAQTAASMIGAKALIGEVDWKVLISATVMAGISSILTSVYGGLPEVEYEPPTAASAQ